jgi:hypothetical protein
LIILFWFVLVFIYKNNQFQKKKNQNWFKPTGFGSVILEQKLKPYRPILVLFGSVDFALI